MSEILYIVIPAYNEEENIEQLVNDWYPVVQSHSGDGQSRLVIINDGSKDRTYEILMQLAKDRPLLMPLTKPNGGHGPTVLYGYRYALTQGADYIFQTDSDGQTLSDEFEGFWNLRGKYDAILGKRPDREDGASRVFVENTLRFLLRMIFKVAVPDANAPFRLMKRELLAKYLDRIPEDYNLPNVMLTVYFTYYHEKVTFRRVTFRPRQGGVNSINIRKIVGIGRKALKDFAMFRRDMVSSPEKKD